MRSMPEIDFSLADQGGARSLSRWLQAHAAAAPISSITVSAETGSSLPCVLQLPAQQLSALERLDLAVGVSTLDDVCPSLSSLDALPSLTSLTLSKSTTMQLRGLSALAGLQWLNLDYGDDDSPPLQVAVLSTLTALTSLQAMCPAAAGPDEATLEVLTALTRLKHLELAR